MKFKYKIIVAGFFICLNVNLAYSQKLETKKEPPIKLNAYYTGDIVSNFNGGIETGITYLGLINLNAGINTEIANWWKGGKIFVNVANTHGGEPSAKLVGDIQRISNIEAGNHSFLYELWYKQKLGKLEMTAGLQDLNADFATNENGSIFNNSSFAIQSTIAENITSPIFPLTALGVNVKWSVSDTFLWETAIYDGTPGDFETNPYNIKWKLNKSQGFLAIIEFQAKKILIQGMTGKYKVGFYYHQHKDTIAVEQRNGGFYFVGDQQINKKVHIFSQIGISPKKMNKNNRYMSLGLNCKEPFDKRPNDRVAIGIAYAGIVGNNVGSETALELNYQFVVTKNIYLRPDIQYIINPAGTDIQLKNALVGIIRFGLVF